jgi:aspartate/methionine/tyrosine aminotransferase
VNQYTVFSVSTPLQLAVAHGLELTDSSNYFDQMRDTLRNKRDELSKMLQSVSLKPIVPHSGYFVLADISKIDFPWDQSKETKDYAFCRWLPHSVGIAAIPLSPFYSKQNEKLASNYARFCFAKKDETLQEAEKRFVKLKQFIKN